MQGLGPTRPCSAPEKATLVQRIWKEAGATAPSNSDGQPRGMATEQAFLGSTVHPCFCPHSCSKAFDHSVLHPRPAGAAGPAAAVLSLTAAASSRSYHVSRWRRVSVKLPDLEPYDLPRHFAETLAANLAAASASRTALASVACRRGCVILMLDMLELDDPPTRPVHPPAPSRTQQQQQLAQPPEHPQLGAAGPSTAPAVNSGARALSGTAVFEAAIPISLERLLAAMPLQLQPGMRVVVQHPRGGGDAAWPWPRAASVTLEWTGQQHGWRVVQPAEPSARTVPLLNNQQQQEPQLASLPPAPSLQSQPWMQPQRQQQPQPHSGQRPSEHQLHRHLHDDLQLLQGRGREHGLGLPGEGPSGAAADDDDATRAREASGVTTPEPSGQTAPVCRAPRVVLPPDPVMEDSGSSSASSPQLQRKPATPPLPSPLGRPTRCEEQLKLLQQQQQQQQQQQPPQLTSVALSDQAGQPAAINGNTTSVGLTPAGALPALPHTPAPEPAASPSPPAAHSVADTSKPSITATVANPTQQPQVPPALGQLQWVHSQGLQELGGEHVGQAGRRVEQQELSVLQKPPLAAGVEGCSAVGSGGGAAGSFGGPAKGLERWRAATAALASAPRCVGMVRRGGQEEEPSLTEQPSTPAQISPRPGLPASGAFQLHRHVGGSECEHQHQQQKQEQEQSGLGFAGRWAVDQGPGGEGREPSGPQQHLKHGSRLQGEAGGDGMGGSACDDADADDGAVGGFDISTSGRVHLLQAPQRRAAASPAEVLSGGGGEPGLHGARREDRPSPYGRAASGLVGKQGPLMPLATRPASAAAASRVVDASTARRLVHEPYLDDELALPWRRRQASPHAAAAAAAATSSGRPAGGVGARARAPPVTFAAIADADANTSRGASGLGNDSAAISPQQYAPMADAELLEALESLVQEYSRDPGGGGGGAASGEPRLEGCPGEWSSNSTEMDLGPTAEDAGARPQPHAQAQLRERRRPRNGVWERGQAGPMESSSLLEKESGELAESVVSLLGCGRGGDGGGGSAAGCGELSLSGRHSSGDPLLLRRGRAQLYDRFGGGGGGDGGQMLTSSGLTYTAPALLSISQPSTPRSRGALAALDEAAAAATAAATAGGAAEGGSPGRLASICAAAAGGGGDEATAGIHGGGYRCFRSASRRRRRRRWPSLFSSNNMYEGLSSAEVFMSNPSRLSGVCVRGDVLEGRDNNGEGRWPTITPAASAAGAEPPPPPSGDAAVGDEWLPYNSQLLDRASSEVLEKAALLAAEALASAAGAGPGAGAGAGVGEGVGVGAGADLGLDTDGGLLVSASTMSAGPKRLPSMHRVAPSAGPAVPPPESEPAQGGHPGLVSAAGPRVGAASRDRRSGRSMPQPAVARRRLSAALPSRSSSPAAVSPADSSSVTPRARARHGDTAAMAPRCADDDDVADTDVADETIRPPAPVGSEGMDQLRSTTAASIDSADTDAAAERTPRVGPAPSPSPTPTPALATITPTLHPVALVPPYSFAASVTFVVEGLPAAWAEPAEAVPPRPPRAYTPPARRTSTVGPLPPSGSIGDLVSWASGAASPLTGASRRGSIRTPEGVNGAAGDAAGSGGAATSCGLEVVVRSSGRFLPVSWVWLPRRASDGGDGVASATAATAAAAPTTSLELSVTGVLGQGLLVVEIWYQATLHAALPAVCALDARLVAELQGREEPSPPPPPLLRPSSHGTEGGSSAAAAVRSDASQLRRRRRRRVPLPEDVLYDLGMWLQYVATVAQVGSEPASAASYGPVVPAAGVPAGGVGAGGATGARAGMGGGAHSGRGLRAMFAVLPDDVTTPLGPLLRQQEAAAAAAGAAAAGAGASSSAPPLVSEANAGDSAVMFYGGGGMLGGGGGGTAGDGASAFLSRIEGSTASLPPSSIGLPPPLVSRVLEDGPSAALATAALPPPPAELVASLPLDGVTPAATLDNRRQARRASLPLTSQQQLCIVTLRPTASPTASAGDGGGDTGLSAPPLPLLTLTTESIEQTNTPSNEALVTQLFSSTVALPHGLAPMPVPLMATQTFIAPGSSAMPGGAAVAAAGPPADAGDAGLEQGNTAGPSRQIRAGSLPGRVSRTHGRAAAQPGGPSDSHGGWPLASQSSIPSPCTARRAARHRAFQDSAVDITVPILPGSLDLASVVSALQRGPVYGQRMQELAVGLLAWLVQAGRPVAAATVLRGLIRHRNLSYGDVCGEVRRLAGGTSGGGGGGMGLLHLAAQSRCVAMLATVAGWAETHGSALAWDELCANGVAALHIAAAVVVSHGSEQDSDAELELDPHVEVARMSRSEDPDPDRDVDGGASAAAGTNFMDSVTESAPRVDDGALSALVWALQRFPEARDAWASSRDVYGSTPGAILSYQLAVLPPAAAERVTAALEALVGPPEQWAATALVSEPLPPAPPEPAAPQTTDGGATDGHDAAWRTDGGGRSAQTTSLLQRRTGGGSGGAAAVVGGGAGPAAEEAGPDMGWVNCLAAFLMRAVAIPEEAEQLAGPVQGPRQGQGYGRAPPRQRQLRGRPSTGGGTTSSELKSAAAALLLAAAVWVFVCWVAGMPAGQG